MRSRLGLVLLAVLLTASSAAAQTVSATTGAVNGTVTDSTKAVMPGVAVTLAGPSMMGQRTETTDQNGFFRMTAVPPGDYQLTFELSGFTTVTRQGIHVGLGFTATVNLEMSTASVSETVTVTGASPVVDLQSTKISTSYEAEKLANLPSGARDYWSTIIAQSPAISMGRVDVGGSRALTQQGYTAYGTSGGSRGVIEGMNVTEGTGGGGTDMYYTDYGSFAEVSVSAVGNTADMPTAGVMGQFISKSGGNTYHGTVYADYENDSMEWHNIDSSQSGVLSGVAASGLSYTDVNRISDYRDFNFDVGGFIKKDRLWWYASYRDTVADQRYANFIGTPQNTHIPVISTKLTLNLNPNNKLIGYYQRVNKIQSDYLGTLQTGSIQTPPTTWAEVFPVGTWKVEYSSVLSKAAFFEIRAGNWFYDWERAGKGNEPRYEDQTTGIVTGTNFTGDLIRNRYQSNGALSYFRNARGEHNFKLGYEVMKETSETTFNAPPGNLSYRLSSGAADSVYLYNSPGDSKGGLWTYSAYLNDTWRITNRLTLNLGVRFDRYRQYLPEQSGPGVIWFPAQQSFPAVDNVRSYNLVAPRLGVVFDISGTGKTVLKFNTGQFWTNPGAAGGSVNPNASQWNQRWRWNDANKDLVFQPGELTGAQPISVSGGQATAQIDPDLLNSYLREASGYIDHELAPNFGIRTGFVWRGTRQSQTSLDPNRPFSAYNIPVTIRDPGPDGVLGNGDDGPSVQGFSLDPAVLLLPAQSITTQSPQARTNHYTWEITATRRRTGWMAMTASFSKTWSHSRNDGINPNACINRPDCWADTNTWQVKANSTMDLPWAVRLTPTFRLQSGSNFSRTFSTSALNYSSSVSINAEPAGAERNPNVGVFDIRAERAFRLTGRRLAFFLDVYNILNTNAEQSITTTSGSSYLRPLDITSPRIARVGAKFDW